MATLAGAHGTEIEQAQSLIHLGSLAGKPVNDVEIFGEGTGIAVRKGDPLKARFNAAIKKVLTDGTFAAENKKVFPFSIAPASK